MALKDVAVKSAKPKARPYKLVDERGLFLLVNPNGSKLWRLRYRFQGKEKMLALGVYPDVSLKQAGEDRDRARSLVRSGVDPSAQRKATKLAGSDAECFEAVAREWHAKRAAHWTPSTSDKILQRLVADIFPWLGRRAVAKIKAPELLAALRRIEDRGAVETAHRALQNCGQVFRYAVATGRAEADPSGALRGALTPSRSKHFAAITEPKAVGALLRALDSYQGNFPTRCALRLAPMLFVRPGELRKAEWAHFDLDAAEWRIPIANMKMRREHIVPLATQALEILRELQPLTGADKYLFPGEHNRARPMCENTISGALKRLGYSGQEMTGHGFRRMAKTLLTEQGWPHGVTERQLAHAERSETVAAYDGAELLPDRRRMMQHWADYLGGVKAGGQVLPFRHSAG